MTISRRELLGSAAGALAVAGACGARPDVEEKSFPRQHDPLVYDLLQMPDEQLAKLEQGRQDGLIELAPVSLPPNPESVYNHRGWPVGTMAGDTLLVVHRHIPAHRWRGGAKRRAELSQEHTYAMVTRSTDGGETWSEPFDLRQVMKPEDRDRGGFIPLSHRHKFAPDQDPTLGYKIHLNAIGTASDGGVVVVSDHGVFRSDDQGKSWVHFSKAMREDTTPGAVLYIGPRLFEHPDYGLVVVGHSNIVTEDYQKGKLPPDTTGRTGRIADKMHFRYSKDGGESWREEEQDLPSFVRPGEPAALLHDGKLLIVSRSYDPAAYDPETDTSVYAQLWSETGWHPLMAKHTTIRVAGRRGRQDTLDIDYNPVTQRLEAAVPARSGGGEGRFHAKEMSLNLWSIDPNELFAGSAQWRFECTLFARLRNGDRPADGRFGRADGFHPGGAVIDAKRGVQHVFVYIGFKEGPAGVFRLTRSLDTPKLKAFLGSPASSKA